jgi:hypothetical protein
VREGGGRGAGRDNIGLRCAHCQGVVRAGASVGNKSVRDKCMPARERARSLLCLANAGDILRCCQHRHTSMLQQLCCSIVV